jgi:hypothetical protein
MHFDLKFIISFNDVVWNGLFWVNKLGNNVNSKEITLITLKSEEKQCKPYGVQIFIRSLLKYVRMFILCMSRASWICVSSSRNLRKKFIVNTLDATCFIWLSENFVKTFILMISQVDNGSSREKNIISFNRKRKTFKDVFLVTDIIKWFQKINWTLSRK